MRRKGVDKEETRKNMIEALGQGFRKHGYGGIGIDGLSKSAGVTSGAFYAHFGSKKKAFTTALAVGLDEVIESLPNMQLEYGTDWVRHFADYYLGESHRNDLERGCAMATLTPEVVRFDSEQRSVFEKKMSIIADIVSRGLSDGSVENRNSRAWAMLGVLIGGINVSRGMESKETAELVATAIKLAVVNAAGRTCAVES